MLAWLECELTLLCSLFVLCCRVPQHNVRLQLTYLDVAPDGEVATKQSLKTAAELKRALEPPKTYGSSSSSSSSSS
jgi:hypothetical protein